MNYKRTLHSCYLSYISHAVIINLPPLLFVLLARDYNLNYEKLFRLVLINFLTQLIVDFLAARLADKVGYRKCLVTAHLLVASGLVLFGLFPLILQQSFIYTGLLFATIVFSMGGGLIEVLVSPIVNQVSGHLGAGSMTLLHSFYCWGQMLTVVVTTIVMRFLPDSYWYAIPMAWSIIPLITMSGFASAPMAEPRMNETASMPFGELLRDKRLWLAIGIMAFSGASETSMAQWASLFAEKGIGVTKIVGDLLGPSVFALLMAVIRMFYGKFESKFPLDKFLIFGGFGCVVCYVTAALSKSPALALAACALTGITVSLMWPGTLHASAERMPRGGTALFGLLALGGDLGCSVGPWMMGIVSDRSGINNGVLAGAILPVGFLVLFFINRRGAKKESQAELSS